MRMNFKERLNFDKYQNKKVRFLTENLLFGVLKTASKQGSKT